MVEESSFIRLGDVIEMTHGYPFPGKHFSGSETGRILLTPGNIRPGGGFSGRKIRFYSDSGPCPGEFLLAPGDMVAALTDLSPTGEILGRPARLPETVGKVYLHNQRLGRIILRSPRLEAAYIYWLMRSAGYAAHVDQGATGSTVKHTAPDRLLSFRFHAPPADVRRQRLMLLEAMEERLQLYDELDHRILRRILMIFRRRFSPERTPGNFFGASPKWSMTPLNETGRLICGRTPDCSKPEFFKGCLPFYKIPDFRDSVYLLSARETLSDAGAASQARLTLPPGTICVSCVATIGLTAITTQPSQTNQQICAVIPHRDEWRSYLFCQLKEMKPLLENEAASGTTTANLNLRRFGAIRIPAPPLRELVNFNEETDADFARLLYNAKNRENIRKMLQGCLRYFFNECSHDRLLKVK